MINATDNSFERILNENVLLLVDFYANWCGPCKMEAEVLEQLNNIENRGFEIVKVNVDECPIIAQKYNVESIPTIIIIREQQILNKKVGYIDYDTLKNMMKDYV